MIKLIIGTKGTGKTKTLIEMVNNAICQTKGSVVCIEKGDKLNDNLPLTVGVEAKATKTLTLSPEWNKDNLRVVVAASTSTDGGYSFVVNNVAECKLGESVDYQYAE